MQTVCKHYLQVSLQHIS